MYSLKPLHIPYSMTFTIFNIKWLLQWDNSIQFLFNVPQLYLESNILNHLSP